jgi:tetratricopeptide (TPR) repeat protein
MVVPLQWALALAIFVMQAISASADMHAVSLEALQQHVIELYYAGKHTDAIPLAKESLKRFRAAAGEKHTDTAASLSWLALLYVAQHDYAKAETSYKSLLTIMEEVFGGNHPNVAVALDTLAMLYQVQRKEAEAEKLWLRAAKVKEKIELVGARQGDSIHRIA